MSPAKTHFKGAFFFLALPLIPTIFHVTRLVLQRSFCQGQGLLFLSACLVLCQRGLWHIHVLLCDSLVFASCIKPWCNVDLLCRVCSGNQDNAAGNTCCNGLHIAFHVKHPSDVLELVAIAVVIVGYYLVCVCVCVFLHICCTDTMLGEFNLTSHDPQAMG